MHMQVSRSLQVTAENAEESKRTLADFVYNAQWAQQSLQQFHEYFNLKRASFKTGNTTLRRNIYSCNRIIITFQHLSLV